MLEGDLQALAIGYDLKGKTYASVAEAIAAAKQQANKQDLIFIGGSTFIVAEAL
jgi:dihydrofolate synthase/folylpolyglutamate synthase